MRRPALTAALLLAVLALPACSLFGDDEEDLAETAVVEEVQARREPVQRVGKVEIGQLSAGCDAKGRHDQPVAELPDLHLADALHRFAA
ncbi:MAG: hypothetical protein AAFV96_12135, partial [Pseudomonadota bacterium]